MWTYPADKYAARRAFTDTLTAHGLHPDTVYALKRDFGAHESLMEAECRELRSRPEWVIVEETRKAVWGEVSAKLDALWTKKVEALTAATQDAMAAMTVVARAKNAGRKTVRLVDVYAAIAGRKGAAESRGTP